LTEKMKVYVREVGDRPALATPARLNAPQGAKALADLLAEEDFADACVIELDWEGDGFTPAMIIYLAGWYRDWPGSALTLDPWVIDLEDAFGRDNMDNGVLRLIVHTLRELFEGMVEARRRSN
jgi:hypothetical protein